MRWILSHCRFAIYSLIWFAVFGRPVHVQGAGEPASPVGETLGDAELHDVLFLDPDRGWAVGDRGVIWATGNGGRLWHLVDSPTTARLHSIHFVDQQNGWIAGGWIHAGSHRSSAVLLRTENGGKKWTRIDVHTLPALRHVHFDDHRNGWAFGDSSSLYSVGLFRTSDGGYTWESLPGNEPISAAVGAVGPSRQALFIAPDATAWSFVRGKLNPIPLPTVSRPRALRFSATSGWLVGDHGEILQSDRQGQKWQPPAGKIPEGMAEQFDWLTVAVRDENCWIAGTPGSVVLHSSDGGKSWRVQRTGQTLPINQLCFFDEHYGWAVGPMGRILATRDGGQTWRQQLSAGERVGLLAVHAAPENVSLELLAKVAADERYLTATIVLQSHPVTAKSSTTPDNRFRDACSSVGTSASHTFVNSLWRKTRLQPEASQMADTIPSDAQLIASAEEQVVRQLRLWRPDVVLTDNISTGSTKAHLVSQAVLQAVQQAADPAIYPDQIVLAGLQPWTVRKLFGVVKPSESATITVDTNRLSMQLGCSLADYALLGRGLISRSFSASPASVGCRLLFSQSNPEVATRGIFSGIPPAAIGDSRRATITPPQSRVEELTQTANQLRTLEEIAARGIRGDGNPRSLLPEVEKLIQTQDALGAGRLLYRLSQQFSDAGEYSSSATCLQVLVERFPDHPLNDAALLALVRYHSSQEMQLAFARQKVSRLPAVTSGVAPIARVTPASFENSVANPPSLMSIDSSPTIQFAERIRQTRPALYCDPRVQFPLVSSYRRLGNVTEAMRLLNVLVDSQLEARWRSVARNEQRRLDRSNGKDRLGASVIVAALAKSKPRLDGRLDELCWQDHSWVQATSNLPQQHAEFKIAHDRDFMYLALRCPTVPSDQGERKPGARERDASLAENDRIELELDVDRDYQTHFQFVIDQFGWTNDACSDDLRWNPQWYVAAQTDRTHWIIEAAIPRAELSAGISSRDEIWNLRLRRVVPLPKASARENIAEDSTAATFDLVFSDE